MPEKREMDDADQVIIFLSRYWLKEKYLAELQHKRETVDVGEEGADLCITSLQTKKRGRKLLLGEKLDSQVQVYIMCVGVGVIMCVGVKTTPP